MALVKTLRGVRWSQSQRCWHIAHNQSNLKEQFRLFRGKVAEVEALKAKLAEAQAKIAVLGAELCRGRQQSAPFARVKPKHLQSHLADAKGASPIGRRPSREKFRRRSVHVPLAACPKYGGPLKD